MEKILIFIKHNFAFLWKIIEWGNGLLFSMLFKTRLETILPTVLYEFAALPFSYAKLDLSDAEALNNLINSQEASDLMYFRPHGFDMNSIIKQFKSHSFLMMGVFNGDKMIGYFFLRFFTNKKCFVGRLIDKDYRGKGIGPVMNAIMYETAWRMGFRCLSTISRNNSSVIWAHVKNQSMVILKELHNDYLLVEFTREAQSQECRSE
jgi:RimJ/RimL family protein N-acetyltransferase